MQLEQQLRDALQRDAAELNPVGRGPEHARRRAFRRKRRLQSGVVVLGAAGLVGGTLAAIESRPAGPGSQVRSQPTAPAADLQWRSVTGTVAVNGLEFTGASGVTYALSTAPGVQPANTDLPPQELYSTRDGVTWTQASLGSEPWVADLTESNDVLYAVGTGPGTQSNEVDFNLSTSSDGGDQWNATSLPVQFTPPQSSVALSVARSVHVARGANTTVVMAKVTYSPDVSSVIGSNTPYNTTAAGVQILGNEACTGMASLRAGAEARLKVATAAAARAAGLTTVPGECATKVIATRPWSDFGITDPAALSQQQVLVRDDGGDWSAANVPADADAWVQDVTATSNGFLMAEQAMPANSSGTSVVQLWSSTDGHNWAQLTSAVPVFDTVSISGDRIIGVNSQTSAMYVSDDAGATWNSTEDVAGLLPAGTQVQPSALTASAGPLGYAVAVRTLASGRPGATYLLDSSDGVSWSVSDLAADGAPANGDLSSVSVGADHVDLSYEVPQGTPSDNTLETYKLVELLGTPKAP